MLILDYSDNSGDYQMFATISEAGIETVTLRWNHNPDDQITAASIDKISRDEFDPTDGNVESYAWALTDDARRLGFTNEWTNYDIDAAAWLEYQGQIWRITY